MTVGDMIHAFLHENEMLIIKQERESVSDAYVCNQCTGNTPHDEHYRDCLETRKESTTGESAYD